MEKVSHKYLELIFCFLFFLYPQKNIFDSLINPYFLSHSTSVLDGSSYLPPLLELSMRLRLRSSQEMPRVSPRNKWMTSEHHSIILTGYSTPAFSQLAIFIIPKSKFLFFPYVSLLKTANAEECTLFKTEKTPSVNKEWTALWNHSNVQIC